MVIKHGVEYEYLTFYGASDDLVEVAGLPGADEFNVYAPPFDKVQVTAQFAVTAPAFVDGLPGETGLRVIVLYDGVWSFAIAQLDESHPLPDWHNRVDQSPEVPYSARLVIQAPKTARVRQIAADTDGV